MDLERLFEGALQCIDVRMIRPIAPKQYDLFPSLGAPPESSSEAILDDSALAREKDKLVAPILAQDPEYEIVRANHAVTRQAFDLVPTQKRCCDIRDGHFGWLQHPSERFDEAVGVQADYLCAALDA